MDGSLLTPRLWREDSRLRRLERSAESRRCAVTAAVCGGGHSRQLGGVRSVRARQGMCHTFADVGRVRHRRVRETCGPTRQPPSAAPLTRLGRRGGASGGRL